MMSNNDQHSTPSSTYVRNWREGFLRPLLIIGLAFGFLGSVTGMLGAKNQLTIILLVIAYGLALATAILPFPYRVRVWVILLALFSVATNELFLYGILGDAGLYFYGAIVIATLMFSPRAGWIAMGAAFSIMGVAGILFLGKFIVVPDSVIGSAIWTDWLSNLAMLVVFGVIINYGMQKLLAEIAFGETRTSQALHELEESRKNLEERIQLRTQDLDATRRKSEYRARQFEAVTQVARVIASIRDMDSLLPRITHVISHQFGHYHCGIFMLDEAREYAVLKAANTEGGQKMLARGHRLKVGQTGIVGYVAGTGNPRVAMNAGEDVVFFSNPDLPGTRSEMALPLRIGRELIGVLDVQSVKINAFTQEDVEALTTLADQVAIAIKNATSFLETQALIAEAQKTTSTYIAQAWKNLRSGSATSGYRISGSSVKPLEEPLNGEHIKQALQDNQTTLQTNKLAVPIRLRGQVMGVINLQVSNRSWTAEEVDIVEAVAERLSLALETSTLLRATQYRAVIERMTSDITGKLSTSIRMESIIQTAAEELSRALEGSDVTVQIQPIELAEMPDMQGEA